MPKALDLVELLDRPQLIALRNRLLELYPIDTKAQPKPQIDLTGPRFYPREYTDELTGRVWWEVYDAHLGRTATRPLRHGRHEMPMRMFLNYDEALSAIGRMKTTDCPVR